MTTVAKYLKETLSFDVINSFFDKKSNQEVLEISGQDLRKIVTVLKKELLYDVLMDIVSLDWQNKKDKRYELKYLFYHTRENKRVLLSVFLPDVDKPMIASVSDIFSSADWAERECFDMMGVKFSGHKNLKRILMWDEFVGYPLRKDYPLDRRQPIPKTKEIL